jgi:hypothetical protein
MRPFEIILFSTVLASILLCALAMRQSAQHAGMLSRLAAFSLLAAIIALVLHLVLEGAHWQMFAAYAALVPAAILVCMANRTHPAHHWLLTATACILLAVSCMFSYAVPMFRLPKPTGPYAVGTSILYMVDGSRIEDASPVRGAKRELVVQLWYPAEPGQGKVAPYRRGCAGRARRHALSRTVVQSGLDRPPDAEHFPYRRTRKPRVYCRRHRPYL